MVNVTFRNVDVKEEAEEAVIFHVNDEATEVEKVAKMAPTKEAVEFEAEHFSVYVYARTRTIATMKSSSFTMKPAKINSDGTIVKVNADELRVSVEAITGMNISLDSPGITVDGNAFVMTGKLYYETNETITLVDYLKFEQVTDEATGNTTVELMAYLKDADSTPISTESGGFVLVVDEGVNAVGSIGIVEIQTREKDGKLVQTTKTADTYTYYKAAEVGSTESLNVIAGNTEADFYYGEDGTTGSDSNSEKISSLTKCTNAVLTKVGENYVWLPLDKDGQTVENTNVYMVTDRLYSFDIALNSIVNEHSEDNGDVYLWADTNGLTAYNLKNCVKTKNNDGTYSYSFVPIGTNGPDSKEHEAITFEKDKLEIKQTTKTLTGRVGDIFQTSALDEVLIYATTNNSFEHNWYYVGTDPSEGGYRDLRYAIKDYLKLNTYSDTIAYFKISTDSDIPVLNLKTTSTTQQVSSAEGYTFYTTREPLVPSELYDPHMINHVQMRLPATVTIERDGVMYTGKLTLDKAYITATYIKSNTEKYHILSNEEVEKENDQESKSASLKYDIDNNSATDAVAIIPASDLADDEKVQIKIKYFVSGTLEGTNGEKITYTMHTVEGDWLKSEELEQGYKACPNHAGYDVYLDLSADLMKEEETSKAIRISKVWSDSNNALNTRPESVTFTLERSKDGTSWGSFMDLV